MSAQTESVHEGAARTPPLRAPQAPAPLGDLRFRKLIGGDAWSKLSPNIRKRFSKRLEGGGTAVYVGHISEMRMSWAGYLLAQCTRLIGAPLPTRCDTGVPGVVTVTEDIATGGQVWTRLYAHRRGFPQVIHSSKRFAGPTGLEEHVGYGIGMTLKVAASPDTILFRSDRYFITVGAWRWYIPRWLCPGDLTVGHREISTTRFAFTLDIEHPVFGSLIHQRAVFEDAAAVSANTNSNASDAGTPTAAQTGPRLFALKA